MKRIRARDAVISFGGVEYKVTDFCMEPVNRRPAMLEARSIGYGLKFDLVFPHDIARARFNAIIRKLGE